MNLKELEYVVAIADEKSLTKAAERLFITPSALTQQVLRLENELHAPLFIRSRSGWQPTEAGEIYLEAARKILFIRQDAYNRLQDQIQRSAYSLTIGLPPERGTDMFSRIYAPFRERFPDVTIQLRETSVHTQQDLIRSGQLDLGFLTLSEAQMTKDEYVSLWEEEILLAVPQKYPEALLQSAPPQPGSPYRVVPLERLQNEPFAMMSEASTLRQIQEDIFRQNGLRPQVAFEATRAMTIFEVVSYNLCCALVCEYYVQIHQDHSVNLYALPEHPHWAMYASYRKGKYLSAAEKYLIQLVRQTHNAPCDPQ